MEGIGSICCFHIPKNSDNRIRRWVRSMALVFFPPEDCSLPVPLHFQLLTVLESVLLAVLLPGSGTLAPWGCPFCSLGEGNQPAARFCAPLWQRWASVLRSGLFHHVQSIPDWIHLVRRLWKSTLESFATLCWDLNWYVIVWCASFCAFDFSKTWRSHW